MTVSEMLSRVSAAELTEWAAYEQITGPLGGGRLDMLNATLCAVVSNANSSKGKARPVDFMPKWDRGEIRPEDAQRKMLLTARTVAARTGTKIT